MCVIINIENGQFPKYDTLKNAESLNSHGGSIAWLENGQINYHKGIKAKNINQLIKKRLIPNNVKTAIIHFRIASVGKIDKKLCHPFQISNKVELDLKVENSKYDLLFHNGTVNNWQEILIKLMQGKTMKIPTGELSDSRIMAFLINQFGHEFLTKLAQFNKFSILTKNGIVKYGKWVKVDNVECSNDYFDQNYYNNDEEWFLKSSNFSNKVDELEEKYNKIANKVNDPKTQANKNLKKVFDKVSEKYGKSNNFIITKKQHDENEEKFNDIYSINGVKYTKEEFYNL